MTEKSKSAVLRPKVRFSQSAESPNSSNAARPFSKPKIRSIVDLKGPTIQILKNPTPDFDQICDSEGSNFMCSAGDAPNNLYLCPVKSAGGSAPCLTNIIHSPENRTLRNEASCDTREMPKENEAEIAPSKSGPKKIKAVMKNSTVKNHQNTLKSTKKSSRSLPENSKQLPKVSSVSTSVSQTRQSLSHLGKENICRGQESEENILVVPENTPRTQSNAQIKSFTTSRNNATQVLYQKKENLSRNKEVASKTAIKTHAEPIRKSIKEIGLMPCMKYIKGRSKSVPMKKTILRDVSSSRSNFYVGPGVARNNSPEQEVRLKGHRSRSEILSGDKLARPEYNSIIGTIKKLQYLREEKVIKDLEHLPAVYRGLVNGKVSSALDFGANEAIYKDLVDLSIDEKQLPSRLTRSKDPEPRQKDLVPKLSDFFVPTNDEEYRKAVLPRPPSPRVLDIWNPYKISDRIFAWKESLDHDQ